MRKLIFNVLDEHKDKLKKIEADKRKIKNAIKVEEERIKKLNSSSKELYLDENKAGAVSAFEDIEEFRLDFLPLRFIKGELPSFNKGDYITLVLGNERIVRKLRYCPESKDSSILFTFSKEGILLGKINYHKFTMAYLKKAIEEHEHIIEDLLKVAKKEKFDLLPIY